MRNLPIIFFLCCYLAGKSQIKDISVYYSVMSHSRAYYLVSLQNICLQTNFTSKTKLHFGVFAFYGANRENSNLPWSYNPNTTQKMGEVTLKYSYQGSQAGVGLAFYYNLIKTKRFILSPGIKSAVLFFTKAKATYSTIYAEYGITDTVETAHATNNFEQLKDKQPGIFSVNFVPKCEFPFTKSLTLLVEPFIAIIRRQKLYSRTFVNTGLNIGLTWKFEKQSSK